MGKDGTADVVDNVSVNTELLEDALHGGGGSGDVVGVTLAGRDRIEQIDGRKSIRVEVGGGLLVVVVDGRSECSDGLFRRDGLEVAGRVGVKGKRLRFRNGTRLLKKRLRRWLGSASGPIVLRGRARRGTMGKEIANPVIRGGWRRSYGLRLCLTPAEDL